MARLATAWGQTSLIPQGQKGYRMWRSGEASGVRVLATQRSHSPEVQAVASRIFGEPAFPSHVDSQGTIYGRVRTLEEDTQGWRVWAAEHDTDCLACMRFIVPAISHAAVTGSIGATYGEDGSRVGRGIHNVTVRRVR
jgi:hypothetical protein